MSNEHVVIVGTGFAGLGMAMRLKMAGFDDFTVLEKASRVGGTWRDNHYPGAACDVMSHLYSYSFEPNPRWSRMFAPQGEILEYLDRCAEKYGVTRHIRFDTSVVRASFDEAAGVWDVATSDGRSIRAKALVAACGALSRPSLPDIAGLASFEGKMFHSARWDRSSSLEGKRVAVIGTGASAIQIVPAIAPRVAKLHLFQRTPPWVLPKPDGEISARTQAIFHRAPVVQGLARKAIYGLTEVFGAGFAVDRRIMTPFQRVARRFLEKSVPDPALRAKLSPTYTIGCKRILLSNDYYPALLRDNVELVTEGIESIGARAVHTAGGGAREVDAIVLATGFQAAEAGAPFEITGRGGRDLGVAWRDGAEAYLGTTVSGFPNLFLLFGPNTTLGHSSMVLMFEAQIGYVLGALSTIKQRGLAFVDVREEVQRSYNERLHQRLGRSVWASGCASWYWTKSGKNTTLWPGFTFEFRLKTRRFDASSYELVPA